MLEVLVSSALFSFVMAGIYLLYTTMQTTLDRGQVRADLQQNARVGLDRLVQDLRMAGYSTGSATALRAAAAGCLSFVTGVTQITYDTADDPNDTAVPPRKVLRRREGGGSPQPQAQAVGALTFTYYDVNGQTLIPASTGLCPPVTGSSAPLLTPVQSRQVTRVVIALRTGSSLGEQDAPVYYTLKSDVRLRNR